MSKVLITASVQQHITCFHFPLIDLLHQAGCSVEVAARDVLGEKVSKPLNEKADKVFDLPFDRSPLSKDNITAYKTLKTIVNSNDYDVISCNTPVVSILTRLAARKARKKGTKVIYTAHGFHFYKGAPKLNWIIYYPLERFIAKHFTDCLVTVCNEDYERAVRHRFCKSIKRVHSMGVDSNRFYPVDETEKSKLREKHSLPDDAFICLCTGELNDNKNQKVLIGATEDIVKKHPEFILLLVGVGPDEQMLRNIVKGSGLEKNVLFLGYRDDVDELVKLSDVISSASLREGLPMSVLEGMTCGKPIVVSHNRGHDEYFIDKRVGSFIPFTFSEIISDTFIELIEDEKLRKALGKNAEETACKYSLDKVRSELKDIYYPYINSDER